MNDGDSPRGRRSTFVEGDSRLARYLARPVQQFLHVEAAGGIVLLVATVVALLWANSPWSAGYGSLFGTEMALEVGSYALRGDLTHWINDGLMTLFFLVVGLEIKREWVTGELRDRTGRGAADDRRARRHGRARGPVPPRHRPAARRGSGWGIPMATDIAFALGVVAVLGRRVPTPLKVFLLTLAVVDDIGAIVVIAVAYTGRARALVARSVRLRSSSWSSASSAPGSCTSPCTSWSARPCGSAPTRRASTRPWPGWSWACAAARPARCPGRDGRARRHGRPTTREAVLIRTSVPVTERLTRVLHPWTSYVIVPLFALANAGIDIDRSRITSPDPVTTGVVLGLVRGQDGRDHRRLVARHAARRRPSADRHDVGRADRDRRARRHRLHGVAVRGRARLRRRRRSRTTPRSGSWWPRSSPPRSAQRCWSPPTAGARTLDQLIRSAAARASRPACGAPRRARRPAAACGHRRTWRPAARRRSCPCPRGPGWPGRSPAAPCSARSP